MGEEVLQEKKSNIMHHFTTSVKIFSLLLFSLSLSIFTCPFPSYLHSPYPPVSSNHDVMISTDFHPIVNSETQCGHIQNSLSG